MDGLENTIDGCPAFDLMTMGSPLPWSVHDLMGPLRAGGDPMPSKQRNVSLERVDFNAL